MFGFEVHGLLFPLLFHFAPCLFQLSLGGFDHLDLGAGLDRLFLDFPYLVKGLGVLFLGHGFKVLDPFGGIFEGRHALGGFVDDKCQVECLGKD